MRITLVGPTVEENLAIGYLAAALREAGHHVASVSFVDDVAHREAARAVAATEPDIVGLSMSFQCRATGYLALVEDLRAGGFAGHVVAGGHLAALAAGELLPRGLDSVLVGEAEESIVALVAAIADGGDLAAVPGIVLGEGTRGPRPRRCADLDALPFPARDEAPRTILGVPTAPMVASRGCRGRCAYCSIAAFASLSDGPASPRRERSPENVADEMRALWRERGVRVFVFHDDDFLGGDPVRNLERATRLAVALAERGLPRLALSIKARPDDVDPAVIARLVDAGLVRVFLGVETDAAAGLHALVRGVAPGASRRALRILGERRVAVAANLLLWEPGTTLADLEANLAFTEAFPAQLFDLARVEPYEGAPLTLGLARAGRLLGDLFGRDYRVADPAAERAWQLFRRSLGTRCYPQDGVVKLAGSLAFLGRLAEHLRPSSRTTLLAVEASARVAEVAASNRRWLRRIVEAARAGVDDPTALLGGVRAEDERLAPALHAALAALEGEARPRAPRRMARLAPLAFAAAGALACSNGARTRDGQLTAAAGDAGPVASAAQLAPAELSLKVSDFRAGMQCQGAPRSSSFPMDAELSAGAQGRIERFTSSDGQVASVFISPDGRRAHAELRVGNRRGVLQVTVESSLGARTLELFQYGDGDASLGADEKPDPRCAVMPGDPAPPPPAQVLAVSGDVVFTEAPYGETSAWGRPLSLAGGLRAAVAGELSGPPEATCTTGRVYVTTLHPQRRFGDVDVRDPYLLTYDPTPSDRSGQLQAGPQTLTLRFRLRAAGKERVVEGKLTVTIDPDGTAAIRKP